MMEPHLTEVKTLKEMLEVPHLITTPEPEKAVQNCGSDQLRIPLEDMKNESEARRSQDENEATVVNEVSGDDDNSLQFTMIDSGNGEKKTFVEASDRIVTFKKKSKEKAQKKKGADTVSTTKKTVEIAVFTDVNFYTKMQAIFPKDTVKEIKNYVMTVVHAMDLLYEQSSLGTVLVFRLVYLEIQQKWPSNLSSKHNGKGSKYIQEFCKYAGGLNSHLWDHSLMLTGMDLLVDDGNSNMAGLAYVDAMCFRYSSCSVSEGTDLGGVFVITHEIGHSLGMDHDGEGPSSKCDKNKYIMSPTTGPGKLAWSTCSAQNLKEFLQYGTANPALRTKSYTPTCLTISSKESKTIEYASSTLPGQKYDANTQCTLSFGKGYTPYIPKSGSGSNICAILYCGNTKSAISTHPALEGTTCATGKYCRAGQCVVKK